MFYLLPHLPSGQPVGRKKCYVFLFPEPFPFQRQKMVQVIRKEFPGTGGISRFTGTQDGFGSVQKQNVLRHTSLHRCKLRGQSLPDRFDLPLQPPAFGVVQGVELNLLRAEIHHGVGVFFCFLPAAQLIAQKKPLDLQIVRIAVLIQPTLLYLCKDGSVVLKTNLYLLAVLFQIAGCRGLSHCHATL